MFTSEDVIVSSQARGYSNIGTPRSALSLASQIQFAWSVQHQGFVSSSTPKGTKSKRFTTSQRFHNAIQKYLTTVRAPSEQAMAPKRNAREPTPSSTATAQSSSTASVPSVSSKASHKSSSNQSPQQIALGIWQNYLDTTPQRTKLIDVFMAFLVVVGGLQFVYCVIAGNYVRTS